jgi:DNA-binding response OmpR family regulator
MPTTPKRILVVAHDPAVKSTRTAILAHAGYDVEAVETPAEALARLEAGRFDLVLVGRKATGSARAAGALVRERYPSMPILKVAPLPELMDGEQFATRSVEPFPPHVVNAVRELIGE